MIYIIALVALVIVFFVIKFIRSASPKGFARGLAKAQLLSFSAAQNKYPGLKPVQLYVAALKMRPGYTEEDVLAIVRKAKMAQEKYDTVFNFQEVVVWLAVHEYQKRTGEGFAGVYNELREGVTAVIPSNI